MDWQFVLDKILFPTIGCIVGIFIGIIKERRDYINKSNSNDIGKLIKSLPSFRSFEYAFKEKSFNDSFKSDIYHEVYEIFRVTVEDPTRTPLDEELAALIIEIKNLLEGLSEKIVLKTFPTHDDHQTIKRKKWGDDIDDFATGEWLNKRASEIFVKYTELIKTAKSKGYILE